ncbi:MAG: hypothetical protein ACLQBD_04330 [Syntrophobacteraceae bacterium]
MEQEAGSMEREAGSMEREEQSFPFAASRFQRRIVTDDQLI